MCNLRKNKAKYEYYGSRIILLIFFIIEIIGSCILIYGLCSEIIVFKVLGLVVIAFGLYIIISNFLVMFSLIVKSKKNTDILNKMVSSLKIKGHEHILDAGCGRGRISILLAKQLKNGKITAVDIGNRIISSNDVLIRAAENAKIEGVEDKIEFIRANILDLPFENNYFDILICNSVLQYLVDGTKIRKAVSEFKRVLNSNGKFMLTELVRSRRGFFICTPFFFFNLRKKEEWSNIVINEGFSEIENFEDRGRVIFVFQKSTKKQKIINEEKT